MKGSVFSYVRLMIACWLFVGGLAFQFWPSAGDVAREARARDRAWKALNLPDDERQTQDWLRDQQDNRSEAIVKLAGILIGGLGLAVALHETAYRVARFQPQD